MYCAANFWSSSGESSIETPRTVRPLSLYFCEIATSPGISSLQGPHHVAQKLMIRGLPLKSASFTSLPDMSLSVYASLTLVGVPFSSP